MTVEKKVRQLLSESTTEEEANDILKLFKESKHGKPMRGRWSHAAEDYMPSFLAALLLSIELMPHSQ